MWSATISQHLACCTRSSQPALSLDSPEYDAAPCTDPDLGITYILGSMHCLKENGQIHIRTKYIQWTGTEMSPFTIQALIKSLHWIKLTLVKATRDHCSPREKLSIGVDSLMSQTPGGRCYNVLCHLEARETWSKEMLFGSVSHLMNLQAISLPRRPLESVVTEFP